MAKGKTSRTKNKNVVGNDSPPNDGSIKEIEEAVAAAAGLVEVPEVDSGSAGEESTSPAAVTLPAPPAEDEGAINALETLLAEHAEPGAQPAAAQQLAEEQETGMDGIEDDAPAPEAVPLSQEKWME